MPQGVKHIFVSYRNIESDFALQLAADLKNAGFAIWVDRIDHTISPGDDWRASIEAALTIDACEAVLAILSPEYLSSKYCRNELARADRLGLRVYPVLLHP